jgi:RNA polymerase sigma factor (sigma-70 family)
MTTHEGRDEVSAFFVERQGELLRYAYALCGDREVAEDLVADAVARSLPRLRRGAIAQPRFYLRRAVFNAAAGRHRRRVIERGVLERLRSHSVESRDAAESPEAGVADRDALQVALLRLPLPQRAAVVLRYLEDYSDVEVARVMGTSVGTAKSRISRGVGALRQHLGAEDADDFPSSSSTSSP